MLKRKNISLINKIDYKYILNSPKIDINIGLNKEKIKKMEYGSEIESFYNILLKLKDIDFSYFCNNINNLETQNIGSLVGENARAGYSVKGNFIVFKDYFQTHEIQHELLHLSSSIYDLNNYTEFCGFSQNSYIYDFKIGIGLNEGYTENLNEKLFKNKQNVYLIERSIAKSVEDIIGNIEMEKLFFTANLKELIEILSKYNNINQTIEFIQLLDYISSRTSKIFNTKKLDKDIIISLKKCVEYIIYTYIKKLNIDIQNEIINSDEYKSNLEVFLEKLGVFNYYIEDKVYNMRFIKENEVKKIAKRIEKQMN